MTEPVRAIGIDFGTTSSKIAWYNPDIQQAQVLHNGENQEQTPSVVYYGPPPEEPIVGQGAAFLLEDGQAPARIIAGVKRDLADQRTYALPEDRFVDAESVVATILKKLKYDAEVYHFQGQPVTHVVLTCPAEFDVEAREQLLGAARGAGFAQVELLDEPAAAAIAYARASRWSGRYLAVYDLGGGTFDVAVLAREDDGTFAVVPSPRGIARCGGEDFDSELYILCDELARAHSGQPFHLDDAQARRLRFRCRRYKEILSRQTSTQVSIFMGGADTTGRVAFTLERAAFEQRIRPLIEDSVRVTESLLQTCARKGIAVETLVLIGGSSAIPLVEDTLRARLPPTIQIDHWGRSTLAVALGAAYKAAELWQTPARSDATCAPAAAHLYDTAPADPLLFAQTARLEGVGQPITCVAAGGGLIAARSGDGTITFWSRQARRLERSIASPAAGGDRSPTFAISRDASTIAVSTAKHVIQIMALTHAEPQLLVELAGHKSPITGLVFDPAYGRLLSGSEDGTVRLWDLTSGEATTLPGPDGPIRAVSWSLDDKLLAAATRTAIYVWNSVDQALHKAPVKRPQPISALAFSCDGQWLASAEEQAVVLLFNIGGRGFAHLHTLAGHTAVVKRLVFSADGRYLFSAGDDKRIIIWDVDNARLRRRLEGHTRAVSALALSPDGRALVSGGDDKSVRVWSAARIIRTRAALDAIGKDFLDACVRNLGALKVDELKDGQKLVECVNAAARDYTVAVEQAARKEAAEIAPGFQVPTMEELEARAALAGAGRSRMAAVLGAVAGGVALLVSANIFGRIVVSLMALGGVQRAAAWVLARRQATGKIREEAAKFLPQLRALAEQYLDDVDRLLFAQPEADGA